MTTATETQSKTRLSNRIFFGIGVALRLSPLLNPIHEIFHVLMVEITDGKVIALEWSRVLHTGGNVPLIHAAGYWGELIVYWVISMLWADCKIAPLLRGILLVVLFRGPISYDFAKIDPTFTLMFLVFGIPMLLLSVYRSKVLAERTEKGD